VGGALSYQANSHCVFEGAKVFERWSHTAKELIAKILMNSFAERENSDLHSIYASYWNLTESISVDTTRERRSTRFRINLHTLLNTADPEKLLGREILRTLSQPGFLQSFHGFFNGVICW
jgi:hypothetical protein